MSLQLQPIDRHNPGQSGRVCRVKTNAYKLKFQANQTFFHYDVVIKSDTPINMKRNLEIIDRLQTHTAPATFKIRGFYDGKKNFFSTHRLDLQSDRAVFEVWMMDMSVRTERSRSFRVSLELVAEVGSLSLQDLLNGKAKSFSPAALSTLTLLNICIRMTAIQQHPFNARSFFVNRGSQSITGGLEVWRGYFQSVRPTLGSLIVNVDVTTAVMYRPGPLIELCMKFLQMDGNIRRLAELDRRTQNRLQRFLKGVQVKFIFGQSSTRIVKKIKEVAFIPASEYEFEDPNHGSITVQEHFFNKYQKTLRYPFLFCARFGKTAAIPIELCEVVPGQIYNRLVPAEHTPEVLKFSTHKPQERFDLIEDAFRNDVFKHQSSDYMRNAGLMTDYHLIEATGRLIDPPQLTFGDQQQKKVQNGSWNMTRDKFFTAKRIGAWSVLVLDQRAAIDVGRFVQILAQVLQARGMALLHTRPPVITRPPGDTNQHIQEAGRAAVQYANQELANIQQGGSYIRPDLILVVLPSSIELRTEVKHYGDCVHGCATQIVLASKVRGANDQYCNNLALKINAKLGGISVIPTGPSVPFLSRAQTMVVGADVSHPAGGQDTPSIAGIVYSVERTAAKYAAITRVQKSRQEIIEDLYEMMVEAFQSYNEYWRQGEQGKRELWPQQILWYRDGVSEGQFEEVGLREVAAIQAAFRAVAPTEKMPALTFIIVGKRHHFRFFPSLNKDRDPKNGNALAGLVVDQDITSPVGWDFYLQSQSGLIGTSRPSHYSVIFDDNRFTSDELQSISFALCHVYARATRSVSIPAPVYYADIVCGRGRNHFDPSMDFSDGASLPDGQERFPLEELKRHYRPIHSYLAKRMYFM